MTACHLGYRNKHFLLSFSSLLVCKGITVIYIIKVKYFLSLHFNDHFTGGPGIDGARMSAFWILLQLRMIEVTVTTGAIRRANLQSNYHQQPTPSFFTGRMPFLLPNQQRQSTTHIALLCTGTNYEQQYWITQTH